MAEWTDENTIAGLQKAKESQERLVGDLELRHRLATSSAGQESIGFLARTATQHLRDIEAVLRALRKQAVNRKSVAKERA